MDLIRIATAAGFCLILAVVAIAIVARRKGGFRLNTNRRLKLQESLMVDARTALHLVELDGASLLIVSTSGEANVRELPRSDEASP